MSDPGDAVTDENGSSESGEEDSRFGDPRLMLSFIADAPIGIAVLDSSMRFLYINSILAQAHNRSVDDHLGKTAEEMIPDQWPDLQSIYARVLAGESVDDQVVKATTFPVQYWQCSYFSIDLGLQEPGIGVMATEITGFVNAAEALSVRKSLYTMLARTNDSVSRCETAQQLYQEVCDIAVESGEFRFAWIAIPEGERVIAAAFAGENDYYLNQVDISLSPGSQRSQGPTGRALLTGVPVVVNDFYSDPLTAPWHDLADRVGFASSAAFPIKEEGEVVAVLTVYSGERGFFTVERVNALRDVTPALSFALDRIAAQQALQRDAIEIRKQEERARFLAAIVESSSEGIIGLTLDGTVTSWNQGAERMFGYRADEVVGKSIGIVVPPALEQEPLDLIGRMAQGNQVRQFETQRVRKDGQTVEVSITLSPIHDASGAIIGVSTIASDITDRIRAERDRKEIERRLGQLERLESLGMLAGGIAHDFNNLLGVILNYAGFVENELDDQQAVRADIEQIRKASERAISLTRQLLTFARREIQKPVVLNVNDVVVQVGQLLDRTLGAHIELKVSLADDLFRVEMDPAQFEQIVMNLVLNARDAMPNGGSIIVDTSNFEVDQDYVGIRPDLKVGSHVQLRVSDSGAGMTSEVMERVFEPFFTTKPVGEGTGLGLPIAFGIVRQVGGDIQLESQLGVGTTCRVLIPVAKDESMRSPKVARERELDGTETILVVEDEDALREVTRRILASHGYTILAASNGPEAIAMALRYEGTIDLLLTDVIMPKMLGNEVAAGVKEVRPEVAVLFMSGYAHPVLGSILDGEAQLLDKPFSGRRLLEKIRDVLECDR